MQHIRLKEWSAIALLLCGVIMAIIALFLPPPGEIHNSVIYIFAQILIYAGSVFGIDAYIQKAIDTHRDTRSRSRDHPSCDHPDV